MFDISGSKLPRFRKMFSAGASLALLASSGAAMAAPSLDCMAQTYDAEQLATIASLNAKFTVDTITGDDKGKSDAAGEAFADLAGHAVGACAADGTWSEDQILYGIYFEIGRLSEQALRSSGALTPAELTKLDTALAKQDRTALWAALEKSVGGALSGEKTEMTKQDEMKVGLFAISAGFGGDDKANEKVGVILGMMAIQRYARREFDASGQE